MVTMERGEHSHKLVSLERGSELVEQLKAVSKRTKADFIMLKALESHHCYIVGVQTKAEPFTIIKWFESVELLVIRMDTMSEPHHIYFRELEP